MQRETEEPRRIRKRLTVTGAVQGVGFRPFVYRLAHQFSLAGRVENNPSGVTIEVEGEPAQVSEFLGHLRKKPPPLAHISGIQEKSLEPTGEVAFTIAASRPYGERIVWISPDTCVCDDCLAELLNPADRRHWYPFINCTHCGPRYTLITDVPYDRAHTTMRKFVMCADCQREYDDPANRRFHAQPNACPRCGPQVSLLDGAGRALNSGAGAIRDAARLLNEGRVVAVKGLGGFHLAVDAANPLAVERLRRRKRREEKPLAVMARNLEEARRIALIDETTERLLISIHRPIVLLPKRQPDPLAPAVAPTSQCHGVMLPYAPLHYLLLHEDSGGPAVLVMTSGNISDEPIATDNEEALERLSEIADFFLVHDRDIYIRTDDSVMTVVQGRVMALRRSRGYVPVPLEVALPDGAAGIEVLAVGAELKNVICITRGNTAILSQHVGDLKNFETYASFEKSVEHLERIMQVRPAAIAHDLHPLYMSTEYARVRASRENLRILGVQHHHAHFAACLADCGHVVSGRAIGAIYDGTGYGTDGAIWGGEFLVGTLADFERAAHLEYVPMPGGDAAIEQPWRMALAYLFRTYGGEDEVLRCLAALRAVTGRPLVPDAERKVAQVKRMIELNVNSPPTSSMGRLFDAVSAMTGVCGKATYEGQPAVELEGVIEEGLCESYPFAVDRAQRPWIVRITPIIRRVVEDIREGVRVGRIAAKFHNTVVELTVEVCRQIRESEGLNLVALSGGCFQNRYLVEHVEPRLATEGFRVLSHSRVPPNDGGVALGQAVVAKHQLARCGGAHPSTGKPPPLGASPTPKIDTPQMLV